MSWPSDGKPRFIVTEISGWHVPLPEQVNFYVRHCTTYYVLDRAHCHDAVATFENPYRKGGFSLDQLRAKAERCAEALNAVSP